MYFKGIVAWDGFGPILSLFLSYLNRKCSTVTLFCTVQQWLSIPELMHSIKWKENVALITLARCQVTFWKTEKKKKYFEVSMKQDGNVLKFYICLAQTGQNKVTGKAPSSAAFLPLQELVAVLALLCSPHANASMKQYECGRTQHLFRAGHDRGKTSSRNLKG